MANVLHSFCFQCLIRVAQPAVTSQPLEPPSSAVVCSGGLIKLRKSSAQADLHPASGKIPNSKALWSAPVLTSAGPGDGSPGLTLTTSSAIVWETAELELDPRGRPFASDDGLALPLPRREVWVLAPKPSRACPSCPRGTQLSRRQLRHRFSAADKPS